MTEEEKKKRRTRGDGAFYQRADGMWVGRVELATVDGKRRYRWVTSKNRNTAIDKLKKVRREVEDGTLAVTGSTTVEKWLTRWLEEIHGPKIRPGTLVDYQSIVNKHLIPTLGAKRLDKLTPDHVRLVHRTIGPSRIAAMTHTVLQKALKDAVREGMISRNVCELVDKPTYKKKKRTNLSVEVVQRILRTAVASCDESQATRWAAAFYTGARQGELLGLRWDYVDLDAGEMDISWQLQQHRQKHGCGDASKIRPEGSKQKNGPFWPCGIKYAARCPQRHWDLPPDFEYEICSGALLWTRPKSDAGLRIVPLVAPLLASLKHMHANQGPNPYGLVWTINGRPITARVDYANWTALLIRAGIINEGETLPLHNARHTAVTILRTAGIDEQSRMELFGHTTVDSQRGYAHGDRERKHLAMEALKQLEPKRDE
jgi:integrase